MEIKVVELGAKVVVDLGFYEDPFSNKGTRDSDNGMINRSYKYNNFVGQPVRNGGLIIMNDFIAKYCRPTMGC